METRSVTCCIPHTLMVCVLHVRVLEDTLCIGDAVPHSLTSSINRSTPHVTKWYRLVSSTTSSSDLRRHVRTSYPFQTIGDAQHIRWPRHKTDGLWSGTSHTTRTSCRGDVWDVPHLLVLSHWSTTSLMLLVHSMYLPAYVHITCSSVMLLCMQDGVHDAIVDVRVHVLYGCEMMY